MFYTNLDDYRSRYIGTYIGKRGDGILIPLHVRDISGTAENPKFHASPVLDNGDEDVDHVIVDGRDQNIILSPPKFGMFGSRGLVSYAERTPRRRWKQGLSLNNYDINSLNYDGYNKNVYDMFNVRYIPVDDAIKLSIGSRKAYPISRYFAVVGTGGEEALLYCRRQRIAKITADGGVTISSKFNPMVDTIARLGFKVKVKNSGVKLEDGNEKRDPFAALAGRGEVFVNRQGAVANVADANVPEGLQGEARVNIDEAVRRLREQQAQMRGRLMGEAYGAAPEGENNDE